MTEREAMRRWECEVCETISARKDLLSAPNPFDDREEILGCPQCKSVEGFTAICEIEACTKEATCGGPSSDGVYRSTCGAHADWLRSLTSPIGDKA
jgi:hypothetical protein